MSHTVCVKKKEVFRPSFLRKGRTRNIGVKIVLLKDKVNYDLEALRISGKRSYENLAVFLADVTPSVTSTLWGTRKGAIVAKLGPCYPGPSDVLVIQGTVMYSDSVI